MICSVYSETTSTSHQNEVNSSAIITYSVNYVIVIFVSLNLVSYKYTLAFQVLISFFQSLNFIQGINSIRSVVISLRLLPKIFVSFHQSRGNGLDVNQITLWAFQKHAMMDRVFANLITYMKERSPGDFYSHLTHVQVRLQFLAHVFSPSGLPEPIR